MFLKLSRLITAEPLEPSLPDRTWFCRPPRLETMDLILRPVTRKDAPDIFAYASDPEVARYVLWDPHTSLADTRSYIRYLRRQYREGLPSSWVMELKSTGKVIGSIGFVWYSPLNHSAEIGYSLARPYWNRGLATQALSAVSLALFAALPLNRLEAQHDVRNPASGRVMEKCGFQREGLLRARIFNKGEMADVVLWSLLRSDLA